MFKEMPANDSILCQHSADLVHDQRMCLDLVHDRRMCLGIFSWCPQNKWTIDRPTFKLYRKLNVGVYYVLASTESDSL